MRTSFIITAFLVALLSASCTSELGSYEYSVYSDSVSGKKTLEFGSDDPKEVADWLVRHQASQSGVVIQDGGYILDIGKTGNALPSEFAMRQGSKEFNDWIASHAKQ